MPMHGETEAETRGVEREITDARKLTGTDPPTDSDPRLL